MSFSTESLSIKSSYLPKDASQSAMRHLLSRSPVSLYSQFPKLPHASSAMTGS